MYFGIEDKNISFFLERLIDGPDNELTIIIVQSKEGPPDTEFIKAEKNAKIRDLLSQSISIIPDYTNAYKIHFEDYIIYQTRNESYCSYDHDESRSGHALILFSKSKLLDYLRKSTDAYDNGEDAYPAKFQHYGVYTQDHIIDIVSQCAPSIEKVEIKSLA